LIDLCTVGRGASAPSVEEKALLLGAAAAVIGAGGIGADAQGLRQCGIDQCDDIADAPVLDLRPMKRSDLPLRIFSSWSESPTWLVPSLERRSDVRSFPKGKSLQESEAF
jgi:hypothetical protein